MAKRSLLSRCPSYQRCTVKQISNRRSKILEYHL